MRNVALKFKTKPKTDYFDRNPDVKIAPLLNTSQYLGCILCQYLVPIALERRKKYKLLRLHFLINMMVNESRNSTFNFSGSFQPGARFLSNLSAFFKKKFPSGTLPKVSLLSEFMSDLKLQTIENCTIDWKVIQPLHCVKSKTLENS